MKQTNAGQNWLFFQKTTDTYIPLAIGTHTEILGRNFQKHGD